MDKQFTQIKMDILAASATISRNAMERLQAKLNSSDIESIKNIDATKMGEGVNGSGSLKSVLVGTDQELKLKQVQVKVALDDLSRILRK